MVKVALVPCNDYKDAPSAVAAAIDVLSGKAEATGKMPVVLPK